MKIAALIGGAALACAAASSATASTPFWVQLTGLPATAGGGAVSTDLYYSGPIGFTTTSSVEFTVYCTDLDHNVSPGGWYEYTFGRLDENGQGAPISQPISNEIAQIAVIGKNGTGDLSVAAQAAIWQLAYPGISQSFSGPDAGTIQADFSQLLSRTYSNNGACRFRRRRPAITR
jgi:hypothetical protein